MRMARRRQTTRRSTGGKVPVTRKTIRCFEEAVAEAEQALNEAKQALEEAVSSAEQAAAKKALKEAEQAEAEAKQTLERVIKRAAEEAEQAEAERVIKRAAEEAEQAEAEREAAEREAAEAERKEKEEQLQKLQETLFNVARKRYDMHETRDAVKYREAEDKYKYALSMLTPEILHYMISCRYVIEYDNKKEQFFYCSFDPDVKKTAIIRVKCERLSKVPRNGLPADHVHPVHFIELQIQWLKQVIESQERLLARERKQWNADRATDQCDQAKAAECDNRTAGWDGLVTRGAFNELAKRGRDQAHLFGCLRTPITLEEIRSATYERYLERKRLKR